MEQLEAGQRLAAHDDHLERARRHYERRAWADAFDALVLADRASPLESDDLERLAMAAYLIGRENDYLQALDRAQRALIDTGRWTRAARCAFWIGLCHLFRGESGSANGWFGRARRMLDRAGCDSAEEGYLLLPQAEQYLLAADAQRAHDAAARAAEIGEHFAEPDLVACARHVQGRALLQRGEVEAGLALLDEAMLAVIEGELSPRMTGLVYCSVIDKCMQLYAFPRAREWTSRLSGWCDGQPQLVTFTGRCLVHRAEILQWHGDWSGALDEARRACTGFSPGSGQPPPVTAFYRQGELHRLRGQFAAAEEAYLEAGRRGFQPQPGLALLRLAQGRVEAAAVAIRRALAAATDPCERARLLHAAIEILLAAGEIEAARRACRELADVAATFDTGVLGAMAAQARGALELVEGDAAASLSSLRAAFEFWRNAEAPYEAARVRELIGLACRALGDAEGAGLELDAAAATFRRLGATPDVARIAAQAKGDHGGHRHGLTRRELQVLRLVSAGMTNKEIASELSVSRRTVDRHVSNLFGKLGVGSRAAATAYAHRHRLVGAGGA